MYEGVILYTVKLIQIIIEITRIYEQYWKTVHSTIVMLEEQCHEISNYLFLLNRFGLGLI